MSSPQNDPDHRHGFLRSSKGAFTTIDVPVPVPGEDMGIADLTIGEGINNAGTIVGVYVGFWEQRNEESG